MEKKTSVTVMFQIGINDKKKNTAIAKTCQLQFAANL